MLVRSHFNLQSLQASDCETQFHRITASQRADKYISMRCVHVMSPLVSTVVPYARAANLTNEPPVIWSCILLLSFKNKIMVESVHRARLSVTVTMGNNQGFDAHDEICGERPAYSFSQKSCCSQALGSGKAHLCSEPAPSDDFRSCVCAGKL